MAAVTGQKDDDTTIKVASKKVGAKSTGVIKLKKPAPKYTKPGNWKDGSIIDNEKKSKTAASTASTPSGSANTTGSPGPVVNQLDETAWETFATGRPLEDSPDLQQCKHCKKSILRTAAKAHIAACLRVKKEKAQRKKEAREHRERERAEQARAEEERKAAERDGGKAAGDGDEDSSDDDDDGDTKAGGSNAGKTTKKPTAGKRAENGGMGGKKRKADGELEKGPKNKKKKDEPKPKMPKPKGPVDVEKQCGVLLPNGQQCARSLTCKSHSMGAKRAVAGRSLPYDMLLAAYQKKNQAKQQKAAIDANAPLEDEDDPNNGQVDSDEETAAVMGALGRWNPQPIVPQPIFVPIKRQYQLARLHEQLQTATNGGRVNIFSVVGFGSQKLPDGHAGSASSFAAAAAAAMLLDTEDAPGEPDPAAMGAVNSSNSNNIMSSSRRSSSSFSMSGGAVGGQPQPPPRRPSITGRA